MATIKDIAEKQGVSQGNGLASSTRMQPYRLVKTRAVGFFASLRNCITKRKAAKQRLNQSKILIKSSSLNGTREEELEDLYYYAIRMGLEKQAQELGYEIFRIFNKDDWSLIQEADGIIALGKFSPKTIQDLESYGKPLIFVDSNTLSSGGILAWRQI